MKRLFFLLLLVWVDSTVQADDLDFKEPTYRKESCVADLIPFVKDMQNLMGLSHKGLLKDAADIVAVKHAVSRYLPATTKDFVTLDGTPAKVILLKDDRAIVIRDLESGEAQRILLDRILSVEAHGGLNYRVDVILTGAENNDGFTRMLLTFEAGWLKYFSATFVGEGFEAGQPLSGPTLRTFPAVSLSRRVN